MDQPTRFRDLTIDEFSHRLGSSEPVPGGGSASAISASLGASLVAMVASLSIGRPKYAAHEGVHMVALATGQELADQLLALADEDAAAYARFAAALKLPRESDTEREVRAIAMRTSARASAEAPMRIVEACLGVAAAAESLAGRSNVNASSDLNVASLLAEAGARGAAANVIVNLPAAGDESWAVEMRERVTELVHEVARLADVTQDVVGGGHPRDPLPSRAGTSATAGGA